MIEKYEGYLGVGSGGRKTRFMGTVSPKHEVFKVPQEDTTEIADNPELVGETSPSEVGRSEMIRIVDVDVKVIGYE